MKKVLLTLLAVIVIFGALAGAGFVGYRIGYNQGATNSGNIPFEGRTERMNPYFIPRLDRDFDFRVQPFHGPMMGRSVFGINIFSPFRLLWNVAVIALVIWFLYWLFTKSGWRITREVNTDQSAPSVKTEG